MKKLLEFLSILFVLEFAMQALTFIIYGKFSYQLHEEVATFHAVVLTICAGIYLLKLYIDLIENI